ncbi:OmpA family protein [Dysgonomonas alginatilytica]|uniref:OmpA family protein n=1 Tax=Dysgonomonas alginatilytica TaxID=1605892 RepID=A0A2V3PQE5_9BACT|nr:OmpA family protein [Dysgonomonas alginatilytica]PXV63374.1 OmpA family protein [Dysgonomonas alginatilytica]
MKKVSLLLCLALAGISATAQESGVSAEAGRKATFTRNGFWDNWFVGAGAGASVYFGPSDQHADFLDRMTVNPSVFVGKWFNPYLGVRFRGQGGKIHTFSGNQGQNMYSMTHVNATVDFMFNVTNYLGKYNENRFYNFIPTVGVGYDHRFENKFKHRGFNGPTFNASLLNTFRITDKLSAFAEVGGFIVERRFDRGPQGKTHWNGIATGTAGLILKVGKVGFEEAVLMDTDLLNDLNGQINKLRRENDDLRNRKPNCPPAVVCPEAPVQVAAPDTYIPNVVFFRLNSANIDNNQEVSIYNTAQFLKSNPDAKIKIIGYADKLTGTAEYNLKLSERRARNVAKVLTDKYKISSDRIKIEWKGSSEQPYKENAWNRVAIFFAQ